MGAPNLTISAEPFELGNVVFLRLAAKTTNDKSNAQLSLKLTIKNKETKEVRANSLQVSFTPSASSGSVASKTFTLDLKIPSNETRDWWNDSDKNFILPIPAPAKIELALKCDGFDQPAKASFSLAAHKSPTSAGSFRFPARATDLRADEYWTGASSAHWSGGDQLFAYDLLVVGWDAASQQWRSVLPGKKGDKNEHYRAWGKPLHAMADGTVVSFRNDLVDNANPGSWPTTVIDYAGNNFYLQHGDELVVYSHLQSGSLNSALTKVGAKVKMGDMLGRVGNSGNSTEPHTHIHSIQGTTPWVGPLRPVPFHEIQVVDRTALKPPARSGPWVRVDDGRGLPSTSSAIWPAATSPVWNSQLRCNGIWNPGNYGQYCRWGYTLDDFKKEEKALRSLGFRLISQQAYDLGGGQWRYDGIWNQGNYDQFIVWGWTLADYQKEAQKRFNSGYRLIAQQAYDIGGGQLRYDAIWNPGTYGQYAAWGWKPEDYKQEAQKKFNDGFRLIAQQAYQISPGQWRYDAIWNPGAYGQYAVWGWTFADFIKEAQSKFDGGYRLIIQQSYDIGGGQQRYDGVWIPGTHGQYAVWGWTGEYFQARVKERFDGGYRLIAQQTYRI